MCAAIEPFSLSAADTERQRTPSSRGSARRPAAVLVVGLAVALGGCARRYPLTAAELARVDREGGEPQLRVYGSERTVAFYEGSRVAGSYEVEKDIREASDRQGLRVPTPRDTAGLIVARGERNGSALLWVTFDRNCLQPECAYGFVQTERDRFRLAIVPLRTGFREPKLYRGIKTRGRGMIKGKVAALGEANEVYLDKKLSGAVIPIDLEVKKRVEERSRTRTRRNQGVD